MKEWIGKQTLMTNIYLHNFPFYRVFSLSKQFRLADYFDNFLRLIRIKQFTESVTWSVIRWGQWGYLHFLRRVLYAYTDLQFPKASWWMWIEESFCSLLRLGEKNKNKTQVTILPVTSLSGNTNTEPAAFCGILRQLTAHPFSSPLQRALAYVGIKEQKHNEGEKRCVICWIFYPGIGKPLTCWVLESLHTDAHTRSHPMIYQGNYIICSLHLAVRTLIYDFSLAATTTSTGFSTILHNN